MAGNIQGPAHIAYARNQEPGSRNQDRKKTKKINKMKTKSKLSIYVLAITLSWVLSGCSLPAKKSGEVTISEVIMDSLVLKQDSIKPVVADSAKGINGK